jgi:hypothetical protein
MKDVRKATVTLPEPIVLLIKEFAQRLGVSRNALVAVAVGRLVVEFLPLIPYPTSREEAVEAVDKYFQKIVREARESLK